MKTRTLVGVAALLWAAGLSWARPEIPYSSISGSATTINFDSMVGSPVLGQGEILSNQFAGQGAVFSVPGFHAYASTSIAALATMQSDPNVIWVDQGGGGGGGTGLILDLSVPVHRIGSWMGGSFGGTFGISAYNGATLLETVQHALTPNPNLQEGFLAIERPELITRLVLFSANSNSVLWNFSIDDLRYEAVPTPAAAAVLGMLLCARRRRACRTRPHDSN